MSLSLGAIVLNVPDFNRSAAFWSKALGYEARPDNPAFLAPRNGDRGPRLHLDETDRIHLDLWVDRTTSDLDTEVDASSPSAPDESTGPTHLTPTSSYWPPPTAPLFCVIE